MKKIKSLGQHFLRDEDIAKRIVCSLQLEENQLNTVVEIGPGEGVLTKYLTQLSNVELFVIELDRRLPMILQQQFPSLKNHIIQQDVLKVNFEAFIPHVFSIIGNFPYNISTQIIFKILEYRQQIPQMVGMFQKEVAQRICESSGNKIYGILSVLVQAFYQAEYLFTVSPHVFEPPPKVDSGVLRLTRKEVFNLPCDEALFFKIVKASFNQRRKTLWNSLKKFNISENLKANVIFGQRPEQLSVEEFITLTSLVQDDLSQT